jgi:hypothetical protein
MAEIQRLIDAAAERYAQTGEVQTVIVPAVVTEPLTVRTGVCVRGPANGVYLTAT